MPTYLVTFYGTVYETYQIEAPDEDTAVEMAYERPWPVERSVDSIDKLDSVEEMEED